MGFRIVIVVFCVVIFSVPAPAQVPPIGEVQCSTNGGSWGSCDSNSSNRSSNSGRSPRAPAQLSASDQLFNQGNAAGRAGNWLEAERLYRQAIAANPLSPNAHYGLAVALGNQDDNAGALEEVDEALRDGLKGSNRKAAEQWRVQLTDVLRAHPAAPQPARSESASGTAVLPSSSPGPDPSVARRAQATEENNLGVDCATRHDWDCAIRHLKAAVEIDPSDTKARDNLSAVVADAQADTENKRVIEQWNAAESAMQQSIRDVTTKLNKASQNPTDFDGSGKGPASGLDFMDGSGPPKGPPAVKDAANQGGCGPSSDPAVVALCGKSTVVPGQQTPTAAKTPEPELQFGLTTGVSAPGRPVDMKEYATRTPEERAKLDVIEKDLIAAGNQLDRAKERKRAGDIDGQLQALDSVVDSLHHGNTVAAELLEAQQQRMKAGMEILLRSPDYAAAWNASVAIIRKEELAAFASAEEEHRRVADEVRQGPRDQASLDRLAASSDRLRQAQVAAMQRATKQLKATADRLLELSAVQP